MSRMILGDAALALAPDPDDARRWAQLLEERGLTAARIEAAGPGAHDVAWIACTQAPYLAMLAARDVERLLAAARDPFLRREKSRRRLVAELARALEGTTGADELGRRLRAFRAREYIRLGARECGLGDPVEVGRELSHLASACLDAAWRFHDAELAKKHGEPTASGGARARFVVFGMGKHGGLELNFSSDVDLIYAYDTDDGAAGALSLHEYFTEVARCITRTIGDVSEDDVVFRVDLRLRPEGTRGAMANSLAAMERYYESWGRPWERQAWIKARPVAGDLALGGEILAALEPFIYPRTTSEAVIRDVEELNRRIKRELDGRGLGGGFDVKTGEGGIREVEFFVQALQLIHAGKNRSLREAGTRLALDRLFFAGLVSERERHTLLFAYDFLRQVEHRLQLESGRQTHRLPEDAAGLLRLAGRLGFGGAGELASTLALHTAAVAAIFETLGETPEIRPEVAVLFDAARAPEELVPALAALGFRDPEQAVFQIELMRRRPHSPLGSAASPAAARVAPVLIAELAASPDPDQALRHTVDFAASAGAWEGTWRLLDENRPLLRLLASLFGTSAFLARELIDRPELLDALLLRGRAGPRRTREELERAVVSQRIASLEPGDDESASNALRRVKREEVVRIGLADVASELDEVDVEAQLSDLADVCLARTFELVHGALSRKRVPLCPMAVLALGKLGGREMGYASDLDLVFVYDGDAAALDAMTRLAQRLVSALSAHLDEGRLYEVDTRLRPSGQKGTLVSSLAAWREYHAGSARLWERQALIKCRAVAGDAALGARVEDECARFVYDEPRERAAVARAIFDMRQRMERERVDVELGDRDLKLGRGGIVDVEFAAQLLQLARGATVPALRTRSTLPALAAAAAAGLIDDATHQALDGGYRVLRRLENRLRIVHDRPIHEFPDDPALLDALARRAGYRSGSALSRAYQATTAEVRRAYLAVVSA